MLRSRHEAQLISPRVTYFVPNLARFSLPLMCIAMILPYSVRWWTKARWRRTISDRFTEAALLAMRLTASLSVRMGEASCTALANPKSQILPRITSAMIAAIEKANASDDVMPGAAECWRRD